MLSIQPYLAVSIPRYVLQLWHGLLISSPSAHITSLPPGLCWQLLTGAAFTILCATSPLTTTPAAYPHPLSLRCLHSPFYHYAKKRTPPALNTAVEPHPSTAPHLPASVLAATVPLHIAIISLTAVAQPCIFFFVFFMLMSLFLFYRTSLLGLVVMKFRMRPA